MKRFEEVIATWLPRPTEVLFIHEASERGDPLLERYVGKLTLQIDGKEIPVRQGVMQKSAGDVGLEVADFIVNAAGGQAAVVAWRRRLPEGLSGRFPCASAPAELHSYRRSKDFEPQN